MIGGNVNPIVGERTSHKTKEDFRLESFEELTAALIYHIYNERENLQKHPYNSIPTIVIT